MSITDDNKAIVRHFFEAIFDEKQLDQADELFAAEYLDVHRRHP